VLWYIIRSHYLYVKKFLYDASFESKNRKLVQFAFNQSCYKGEIKWKLKLKISRGLMLNK